MNKPSAGSPDTNEAQHLQHERRFAQLDREVAGVKTDVGVLQADVRSLAAGQVALQQSQDRNFEDLKEMFQTKNSEPPKIGMGMLVSVIGLFMSAGVVGIGAFWAAVLLLADPIKDSLAEHKAADHHGETGQDIALLKEQTSTNALTIREGLKMVIDATTAQHMNQEQHIRNMSEEIRALQDARVDASTQLARQEVRDEWARDDLKALKEDIEKERAAWQRELSAHTSIGEHPYGVMKELSETRGDLQGDIEHIIGLIDGLTKQRPSSPSKPNE